MEGPGRRRAARPPRTPEPAPPDARAAASWFNLDVLLRAVDYERPESLADALRLLAANDNARALAGGQTLVNVMKQRVASPDLLVDLGDLEELTTISAT